MWAGTLGSSTHSSLIPFCRPSTISFMTVSFHVKNGDKNDRVDLLRSVPSRYRVDCSEVQDARLTL
jgi:hypothetical protein